MNIKKILFSFLVIAFGVALFPTFVFAGNIKVSQVDGCLPGDQEGISCVPNKVTQSQEISIQGSGFRSVDRITLAFKGDQTFEPLPGYDDSFIVANVPSNTKVGARILVVQGFKKQASGGFILSESAEKSGVEVVASGSTSTDSKPPVVTNPGGATAGSDPCSGLVSNWPSVVSVNIPVDASHVNCVKSLLNKIYKGEGINLSLDGKFDSETEDWVVGFQEEVKKEDPNFTVDGKVGPKTIAAMVSYAAAAPTDQNNPTDPANPKDPNKPDTTTPKNTGLCGFLGEGYQEKNGLCFPPEVVKGSSGSIVASDSIGTLIRNIMRILLTLAGALAVLFIVIGSVMYTTAEGNEGRAKQGKAIITRAIIGLVGSALAYTIVTIVYNLLTSGSVFSG